MDLVSNLLKPPTELENIRNYAKSVKKGEISSKTTSISKCEATSSGKDLRSCDVPTRPIRKTRYQTKQADEQQGSKFPTPAVEDTATTQHTKRVAPVWLSLVSAVNQ